MAAEYAIGAHRSHTAVRPCAGLTHSRRQFTVSQRTLRASAAASSHPPPLRPDMLARFMQVNRAVRRFLANRGAVVGAVLVAGLVAVIALRPWIASHDPIARDIDHGLSTMGAPLPPSASSPLGT